MKRHNSSTAPTRGRPRASCWHRLPCSARPRASRVSARSRPLPARRRRATRSRPARSRSRSARRAPRRTGSTVGATAIAPGDTIQRSVDLINSGSLDLASVTLTTTATTSSLLDTDATNGLQMVIDKCSVAWTEAGPPYTYTCSGSTSSVLASRAVIGSSAGAVEPRLADRRRDRPPARHADAARAVPATRFRTSRPRSATPSPARSAPRPTSSRGLACAHEAQAGDGATPRRRSVFLRSAGVEYLMRAGLALALLVLVLLGLLPHLAGTGPRPCSRAA